MNEIEVVSQLKPWHLAQLPELLRTAARADGHEPLGEHKFLRLQHGDDRAAALLAYDGGRLAGYAHTLAFADGARTRVSAELVVHPEHRRRGIGRALLDAGMAHALGEGAHRIDVWAYNDSQTTARIAEGFGFRPSRRLLHLHRHIVEAPQAEEPAGVRVRAFRPGDDDADWVALNNRIFSGHPENGRWTVDDLRARMAQPWFEPADFLIVEVAGRPAGFCWLKVEDRDEVRVGEIYVIGTAPEHRGSGLGKYLLARGLARLSEREATLAAIYVDQSNSAAVSLYERANFHYHHVDVCYSRDLAAATREPVPERAEVAA
jgi:mycothiol synthase